MSIQVPFLNLQKSIEAQKTELDSAWQRVRDSGYFVLGPEVKTFEKKFANKTKAAWSVGCANGTDTLELSLRALNIQPGDEVITTPLTAMPTLMGITAAGAIIKLVDVSPKTALLDVKKIEQAISAKTKAIVPVHLYGQICEMDLMSDLAKRNKLFLVEDCAQSFGAIYQNRPSGSWGDLSSWSFYPTKNLGALGDGGAVTGFNVDLENRIKSLRNYGQTELYHHDNYGRNSRLDELQAAFLSARLEFADKELEARLKIAKIYNDELSSRLQIITGAEDDIKSGRISCYHLYVIKAPYNRVEFQEKLKVNGVGSLVHYPIPAHLQKAFLNLGYKMGDFPMAEDLCRTVLSLPLNPYMSDAEIEQVLNAVKKAI